MDKAISIYYKNTMELRHIRYFLALAEEGNFTRAARRLGIGQPPLSLQIKALEEEVGARLFYRLPHGAALTEAGSAFLDAVRPLPARAEAALHAARRAARGEIGQLRLGFTGTSALNPVVPAAIRTFRATYPDVDLTLEGADSITLAEEVRDGRLDIAILRPSPPSDQPELVLLPLVEETLLAALPASHPAADGEGDLDLMALKDDPQIMTPRTVSVGLHDAVMSACRMAGFEPVPGPPAPQIATTLLLVSAELGVSLVPESMRQLSVKGVTYRKIAPPVPHPTLALAYRRQRPPALALNFAKLARREARRG